MEQEKQNINIKEGKVSFGGWLKKGIFIFLEISILIYSLSTLFSVFKNFSNCYFKGGTSGILIVFCLAAILAQLLKFALVVGALFTTRTLSKSIEVENKRRSVCMVVILIIIALIIFNW